MGRRGLKFDDNKQLLASLMGVLYQGSFHFSPGSKGTQEDHQVKEKRQIVSRTFFYFLDEASLGSFRINSKGQDKKRWHLS
jgi:hypothetical protein